MDSGTIRIYEPRCCIGVSTIQGTRKYQQDALYASQKDGVIFATVCDGMGGMECGEKASQLAQDTLTDDFLEQENLSDIETFFQNEAYKIDKMVAGIQTADGRIAEAGTTMVAVVIRDGIMTWMSIGDSRIYIRRNDQIGVVTRDHNYFLVLDEQLETGVITQPLYERESRQGDALISFLGIGNLKLVDTGIISLQRGDQILLCSDGLYKSLSLDQIRQILKAGKGAPEETAGILTACALDASKGGQDNTSVVLIEYRGGRG